MPYNLYRRNVQVQITHRNANAPAMISKGVESLSIPSDPINEMLKIDFNLMTGSNAVSNSNYIELYNLNDKTQSFIKDTQSEVNLLAGYGGNLSLAFKGNITKVETTRKNTDMITKIYLGNQVDLVTQAYFSKTYQGLIPIKTIISDAITTFNMPYVHLNIIPNIQLYNFTWDGRTKDLFNAILKPAGLNWFNDKGIINITKIGEPDSPVKYTITPDNGLIDYPIKTDKGVNINLLFNPKITNKSLVEIELNVASKALDGRQTNLFTNELNGVYKVSTVAHKGSSYDGDMLTSLECEAYNE
jgi:hypothetical protein